MVWQNGIENISAACGKLIVDEDIAKNVLDCVELLLPLG